MNPGFTDGGTPGRFDRESLSRWSGGARRADDLEARRRADVTLCAYFREQKYQGPDWDYFVHQLLSYGLTRTRLMLASRAFVRDRPGRRYSMEGCSLDDLEELASDVVLAGFTLFVRKGLVGGEWSPTGGASLATYFDGACRLVFKDQYEKWARRRLDSKVELHDQMDSLLLPSGRDEDGSGLLDRLTLVLDEDEVLIFLLTSEGYSQSEIGKRFGISEKAIGGRVYRARQKIAPYLPQHGRETP